MRTELRSIVVLEKTGVWAAILRRQFEGIVEASDFDDCLQRVGTASNAVVVFEADAKRMLQIGDWVADLRDRNRHVLVMAIVPPGQPSFSNWLIETGVFELLRTFDDAARAKRIVQRHFDQFVGRPLSLEQRIWNNLPWSSE